MSDPVDSLVMDLIDWLGNEPRPYVEVMEAWRTSCPKLPIWEEANRRGLLRQFHEPDGPSLVALSENGRTLLAERRRSPVQPSPAPT